HGGTDRMNIAVGGEPETRFVVQNVITETAVGRRAPLVYQVLHPAKLKLRVGRNVSVIGIVAGDELSIGSTHTIAGIGKPLPIIVLLCTVFLDRKTRKLRAILAAQLSDPSDCRNRQQCVGVCGLAGGDKIVVQFASSGDAWLRLKTLEVPI